MLYLQAYLCPIVGSTIWDYDVMPHVTDASFITGGMVGYDSARITLMGTQPYLERWWKQGLGKRLVLYDQGLTTRWEGYVNTVKLTVGGYAKTRSLDELYNKVNVIYSTVDESTTPPTVGARAKTGASSDTASQAKYGVKEAILSLGGASSTRAGYYRDQFLYDHKYPSGSEELSISGEPGKIELECLGYWHTFGWQIYENTSMTGTTSISMVVAYIIAQVSQYIGGTLYVGTNTLAYRRYHNDDRYASDILEEICNLGDGVGTRYISGMLAGREFYYAPAAPSTYRLKHFLGDSKFFLHGRPLKPWEIPINYNIIISDWLVGETEASPLVSDPRVITTERVEYSTPWGVRVTGLHLAPSDILAEMIRNGVSFPSSSGVSTPKWKSSGTFNTGGRMISTGGVVPGKGESGVVPTFRGKSGVIRR